MILRRILKILLKIIGCLTLVLIFNEFIIYYITLAQCNWPKTVRPDHIKAIILADIHMLGPFKGHWADKLRREWQMHRTFQSSITLFRPDVIFILGDLFDEGQWVDKKQFNEYIYVINFNNTDDTVLVSMKGVQFVLINSVRMERDGCKLCRAAERKIENISRTLKCAQGITECDDKDAIGQYSRPVLCSIFQRTVPQTQFAWKVSTKWLGKMLEPRVAFSGHSHNYCRVKNLLDIEEYTISSYSWRNKNNPKFLLALFTPTDYNVAMCDMPKESTVYAVYTIGSIASVLIVFYMEFMSWSGGTNYVKVVGKWN